MENDNPFQVYTEYQSRKNKGKKKRRSRANIKEIEQNSDTSDVVIESIENELNETSISNQTNESQNNDYNTDDEYCKVDDRISTDGRLKTAPQIIKPEKISDDESEALRLENIYNTRALSKYAETYELEKFEKNLLVIFNQENVEGYSRPRYGTEKDVDGLKNTFKKFGFEVTEHKDLTKTEIFEVLDVFFKQDFTEYGCVGIAVLTHGANLGLLRAKDREYSEIEIVNYFKVHDKPTLVTKPKFLVVQACRGKDIIPGAPVMYSAKIRTDMDSSKEPYILPVEADLLILHSSYIGSPSHRDEFLGSWFIQSLCNKINQLAATHDIESIITEVKREVAIDKEHEIYNKKTIEMQINKQMPVMTSTLIRKLYLKKFGDPPSQPLVTLADGSCRCNNGSNEVLDSAAPSTPMLIQFGPCSCFLEHYDYMKNCLRYFVEDNPDDEIAESYLELAEALDDGVKFNAAKEKLAKAICKHLTNSAKHCHYYKYLYFYKHI